MTTTTDTTPTQFDPAHVAACVTILAQLDGTEKAAVVRALASKGKYRGRLLAKPPSRDADPLGYAAWYGLQPNPYKGGLYATLFPPSHDAAVLLRKLQSRRWPTFLDRDTAALVAAGAW